MSEFGLRNVRIKWEREVEEPRKISKKMSAPLQWMNGNEGVEYKSSIVKGKRAEVKSGSKGDYQEEDGGRGGDKRYVIL